MIMYCVYSCTIKKNHHLTWGACKYTFDYTYGMLMYDRPYF